MQIEVDLVIRGRITLQDNHITGEEERQQGTMIDSFGKRKKMSKAMAGAMRDAGMERRAERMEECGEWVLMAECPKGDHKKVARSSYCGDRLCPQCAAARARVMARQISAEAAVLRERVPGLKWAFLTVTTENVNNDDLEGTVKKQLEGWRQMARRAPMKRATIGWVRRLEVKKGKDGKHNVHMHALMAMHPDYFTDPSRYLTQKRYQEIWAAAIGHDLTEEPLIIDIRAKSEDSIPEVSKYVGKPLEYIGDPEGLAALAGAIYRKRLMMWGGEMRKIRAELKHVDDELPQDDDRKDCPICGSALEYMLYRWMGLEMKYAPVYNE